MALKYKTSSAKYEALAIISLLTIVSEIAKRHKTWDNLSIGFDMTLSYFFANRLCCFTVVNISLFDLVA